MVAPVVNNVTPTTISMPQQAQNNATAQQPAIQTQPQVAARSIANTQPAANNMTFPKPDVGVINPPPIPTTSITNEIKKHDTKGSYNPYANQNNQQTYQDPNDPAALNLSPDQLRAMQDRAAIAAKNFKRTIIGIGTVIAGTVIAIKRKSIPVIRELFNNTSQSDKVITTGADLLKYKDNIIDTAKKGILKQKDLKDVHIRFIDETTDNVKNILKAVARTAEEYSHNKDSVPRVKILMSKGNPDDAKTVVTKIKEGKINEIANDLLSKIESVELKALNEGDLINKNNDILYEVNSREVLDKNNVEDMFVLFFKKVKQACLSFISSD